MAHSKDLPAAGQIFAESFAPTFYYYFGDDHKHNSYILSELLRVKINELLVAVNGSDEVVGALWLDLADPTTPKFSIQSNQNKYLGWLVRVYHFLLNNNQPGLMTVRGTKKQGFIHWLAVHPEWRGYHIADILLTRAVELSIKAGKKTVALDCQRSNIAARRVYERFGFIERNLFHLGSSIYYVKELAKL